VSSSTGAVFLSYASEDSEAAGRIAEALSVVGVTVWFDKNGLRAGDAWDRQIRAQIHECRLFMPIVSAKTEARVEGYFRREWKLAVDRTHDLSERVSFLVPVVIDSTSEQKADVPDAFRHIQWTRLPGGETPPAFVEHVRRLLTRDLPSEPGAATLTPPASGVVQISTPSTHARPRHKLAVWGICAVVAVVIAYFVGAKFWSSKHVVAPSTNASVTSAAGSPVVPEKSIAVLPFADMSAKHNEEYFADGMVEEIIDLLAKVPDLRVPARTSSFYFKGKATKVPDIARELSVANVLEGSIRASGNRLRVTAQLIRADTGFHIWSQTYDGDLHDVFKVQDEIANAVVEALQITLMGGPLTRREGGTQNLEAYQLYLRGLSASRENMGASLLLAQDYFNRAIKLDPEFGLAWVELSRDTGLLTDNGSFTQKEGYERAREQAQRALQLSPGLAEAHALLCYIHRAYDYDWPAAEAEAGSALGLDPTNPTALIAAGGVSSTLGHGDEAIRQHRLALVRDPFFPLAHWYLGYAEYSANRLADAEATFRKLLALAPGFAWTRVYLAKTLLAESKPEAAIAVMMQESDEHERLLMLSMAHRAAHRDTEAERELKTYIEKFAGSDPYWVAMAYAQRGDNDLAFQWLDRAYQQRDSSLPEILGEHMFKPIATDPRYKAFLHKMKLPE